MILLGITIVIPDICYVGTTVTDIAEIHGKGANAGICSIVNGIGSLGSVIMLPIINLCDDLLGKGRGLGFVVITLALKF